MPASREELEDLCSALWERVRAAEGERNQLRAWADAMPFAPSNGLIRVGEIAAIETWMRKRPDGAPEPVSDESDRG